MKSIQNKENDFLYVVSLIKSAKERALLSVNVELINLYWEVGKYICDKIKKAQWGESVITELAGFITKKYPDLKGYSDKNLWRMKQFYEIYFQDEKLSPLVRELSWTHNMIILAKSKSKEEREFYLRLSIKEHYSKRQLERQIDSCLYERIILSKKPSLKSAKLPEKIASSFKDTYILDFLNLPQNHSEKDFRLH